MLGPHQIRGLRLWIRGLQFGVCGVQGSGFGISSQAWGCRGGLVFKAHRLVHHSTIGSKVIKKKKKKKTDWARSVSQTLGVVLCRVSLGR